MMSIAIMYLITVRMLQLHLFWRLNALYTSTASIRCSRYTGKRGIDEGLAIAVCKLVLPIRDIFTLSFGFEECGIDCLVYLDEKRI